MQTFAATDTKNGVDLCITALIDGSRCFGAKVFAYAAGGAGFWVHNGESFGWHSVSSLVMPPLGGVVCGFRRRWLQALAAVSRLI